MTSTLSRRSTHAGGVRKKPLGNGVADRAELQALGENLPRIWHAVTTAAADRKRILRFVVQEVVLDPKAGARWRSG